MSVCKTCCSHSVTDRSHNTPTLYKHSSENEEPKAGQQTGEVHVQLLSPNHATTVCFLEASLMREKENHSPTSGRMSGCEGKNSVWLIRRDNSCPDLPVHKHKTLRQIAINLPVSEVECNLSGVLPLGVVCSRGWRSLHLPLHVVTIS